MSQPCQALGPAKLPELRPRGHQACHTSRDPSLGTRAAEGLRVPLRLAPPCPQLLSQVSMSGGGEDVQQPPDHPGWALTWTAASPEGVGEIGG